MKNLYLIFILAILFNANGFTQDSTPEWIDDYDTLTTESIMIEYTSDSGILYKIPFNTADTLLNRIFGHAIDSMSNMGSVDSWFRDENDLVTKVFYKCYSTSAKEFSRSWLSDFMSESIALFSYKGKMQLCYLGLANTHFRLISGNIILSHATTLYDFQQLFPHSYHTGMDPKATPDNYADLGYLAFKLRMNWPNSNYDGRYGDPISSSCWVVTFKNGTLFSIKHNIGT